MSLKKTSPNDQKPNKTDDNDDIIVDAEFIDAFIEEYKIRNLHKRPENDPFLFDRKEIDFIKLYEKQLMAISLFLIKKTIVNDKNGDENKNKSDDENKDKSDDNSDEDSANLKTENFDGDVSQKSVSISKDDMIVNRQLFHLITSYLKYLIQAKGANEAFKGVGIKTAFSKEEKKILNAQNASVLAL